MALTPEDVSNKRFTTVRLREGYDMTEVDQFLDEVEAELARLVRENDELRTKVGAGAVGEPLPAALEVPDYAESLDAPEPLEAQDPADTRAAEPQPVSDLPVPGDAEASVEPVPATGTRETLQVTTTAEASAAAIRLLELAGRNADELVGEARQQAEEIVGEARARAESLDAETARRRDSALGDIEREKDDLDREVESLRTFEREYRAELRSYFEDQLAALDGAGGRGSLGDRTGPPAQLAPEEPRSDVAPEGSQPPS